MVEQQPVALRHCEWASAAMQTRPGSHELRKRQGSPCVPSRPDASGPQKNAESTGKQTWSGRQSSPRGSHHGRHNAITPEDELVHVAWHDDLNGAFDILLATSHDSGVSFEAPQRVDTERV